MSATYYAGRYWNDLESVRRHLYIRATGQPGVTWFEWLGRDGRRFDRVLMLNCGNGWVERAMHAAGVVSSVVGVDIDDGFILTARAEAAAAGLDAEYVLVDVDRDDLPAGPFDLVVNHAAAHHIAFLDRAMRQIHDRLSPDGLFVSWDYVGPHRNQYSRTQWEAATAVNSELPDEVRQDLVYPDIELMIATDPSEAVHSELVLPLIDRYFDVEWIRRLGGGIAYPILTHNDRLHDAAPAVREPWVEHVMQADQRFVEQSPEHNLFAFVVARKRSHLPPEQALIDWEYEERVREEQALANGREYGPRTELALAVPRAGQPGPIGAFAARRLPGLTRAYNRAVESLRRSARGR
jgi:SAM-dependent methyltransferase